MEIARHWRMKAQRYRLEGSRCPACGRPIFPSRPACAQCASEAAQAPGGELEALPGFMIPAERDSCMQLPFVERSMR